MKNQGNLNNSFISVGDSQIEGNRDIIFDLLKLLFGEKIAYSLMLWGVNIMDT